SEEHLGEARRLGMAASLHNIVWMNASIYEPGLSGDSFDYAYARWVFVHLNRPIDAMHKVFEVLKPGGIMVAEEPDVSAVYTEPASPAYYHYRELLMAAGEKRGLDYAGGRRTHCWLRKSWR